MSLSIRKEAEEVLAQLPPEGLVELMGFIELLSFKYNLKPVSTPPPAAAVQTYLPTDSLTARFQGLVQSPLKVAELNQAYELGFMGDDE